MKNTLLILTSLILLAFTTADVRSFYTIPYPANAITATDYDLDGDLDILINFDRNDQLHFDKGGIYLLQNNGLGHFTYMDSIITGVGGSSWEIETDTIINNTYPDILFSSDSLYIISTNGANYNIVSAYLGEKVNDFALGDINGDGLLDVVFISSNDQYWGIIYNRGNSTFSEPVYYMLVNPPNDIACDDLNNDGKEEIIVGGGSVTCTINYYSDTGFIKIPLSFGALNIAIADFDNDGDKDIITSSDIYAASLVYLYENKGNDTFDSVGFYRVPEGSSDFFVTDFNNDSLPDVLFLTHDFWNESMMLYYNKGNFRLGDSLIIKVKDYGEARRFMYCADLDGNGFTDIMLTRQVYDTTYAPSLLQLFFNDGKGNFVPDPLESIPEIHTQNKPALTAYPNPFANTLNIKFETTLTAKVLLTVYNLNGQLVKTLLNRNQPPGLYQTVWNGTDKNGKEVTNGTYLIRLQAGRQTTTSREVKIK